MLELYHAPISTCSQKVRLVLAEKQLEWKSNIISFSKRDHLSADYLKLNPNGVVPTLVDNGDPIIDSSIINEYLEDEHPQHPVRPSAHKEVAKMRAWRQYIDEVPTPTIRVPSFNTYFTKRFSNYTDEQLAAYADKLPIRKHFYLKMGREGFSESEMQDAMEKLKQTLNRMEDALTNGSCLIGDMYTLADVSITPTIVRMEDLNLAYMWQGLPRVSEWYSRIKNRPNFTQAYMPGSRELGPNC